MTPIPDLVRAYGVQLIAGALVAGVVTAALVSRMPEQSEAVLLLEIPAPERRETEAYEYDGYYALQASELFGKTVKGWLESPAVVTAIYERADIGLPTESPRKMERVFQSTQKGPHAVEVRYRADTRNEAEALAGAIGEVITERAERAYEEGRTQFSFRVMPSDLFIGRSVQDPLLRAAVAAFVVLVVGFSGIILIDAIRKE